VGEHLPSSRLDGFLLLIYQFPLISVLISTRACSWRLGFFNPGGGGSDGSTKVGILNKLVSLCWSLESKKRGLQKQLATLLNAHCILNLFTSMCHVSQLDFVYVAA